MTLFFDEHFPQYLVEALRLFDVPARHVLDDLDAGTDDVDVFEHLSTRDGIWVTRDKGVKRKPHERRAMIEAGIGVFVFTGRAQRAPVQMMIFVLQNIEEMIRLAERTKRPFVYGISDHGKFERLG